jgi:nickel-dependent lactate racemase
MAAIADRVSITAVTELPPEQTRGMFMESAATPQEALDRAIKKAQGQGVLLPKILVLPDGGATVPVPSRR